MHRSYIDPRDLPKVEGATLRRILSYLRPYRTRAALVVGVIVVCALLNVLPPLFIRRIIDHAIPERHLGLLFLLCGGMIMGPLVAGVLQVAQRYLTSFIGESIMLDLRVQLFGHLHEQPLEYFAAAKPGETISSVLNDVQGVGSVVSSTMVNVVENLIVLVATAALTFVLDWRLALIALAILPAFVAPTRRVGRLRKVLKRAAQIRMAELTGILTETLSVSGALLIKVFGAERFEVDRLRAKSGEMMALSLRQTLVGRWFQMLLGLFESAGPAFVFAGGGWLIIQGDLELGTVVAFVMLLQRLYKPASQLAGVHVDVVTSYAHFDRIFAVLDLQPTIRDAPTAVHLGEARGAVRFAGVSFAYGNGVPVLRGIDLELPAGRTVALVGPSGAGKSTLASLVLRLADPTSGAVLIDGHDIRTLSMRSLRSHIAVVLQDTYLFHASILDNLRYARPAATPEEVEAAAKAAQIHGFIAGLPDGYATLVGDRGYRLSGGERQRVAIARALLKNPRVLILDEATSALDSTSEIAVQAALVTLLQGRTNLVIAHRLSTIRNADLIVVMEDGAIREQGTHTELLARRGLYTKLYREQFGPQAEAAA